MRWEKVRKEGRKSEEESMRKNEGMRSEEE